MARKIIGIRSFGFSMAIMIAGVACGVDEVSPTGSAADDSRTRTPKVLLSAHNSISGSNLDWVHCATEWGADGYPQYCYLGQGGKYMAFGVPGTTSFTFAHFGENSTVHCGTDYFGDPAPGQTKSCYFANFSQLATQGNSFSAYGKFGNSENVIVAYGGSGTFAFTVVSGLTTYTCSRASLGFGSEPNPSGPNDCYAAMIGYHMAAAEGQSFSGNSSHAAAAAFGNNGTFYYANLQGSSISCTAANFGAPAGSGRYCFYLSAGNYYATSEGNNFTIAGGWDVNFAQFTSGKDGNVIPAHLSSGQKYCGSSTFGYLDPDYWETKYCYQFSYNY